MTEKFKDGYNVHEALDRASVVMDIVERTLCQHPAIHADKAWSAKAEEAHQAIFDLYQMIGAEHLK